MVTMGTLGDRVGRRKLLLIGAATFGVSSTVAAFSTNPGMLIAARALLGIAGATLTPSTLALIRNLFPHPKQMGTAIGIWGACFTVGAIIGPIVGGVLLSHFWWGSVFLIGVPAMVLLLVLGPLLLPEYRDANAGRLDLVSVALSLATILPIIYGLKELAREGWQVVPLTALVAGILVGIVFVHRQHRLSDPLLDLRLFANRAFSTTLLSMLLFTMLAGTTMVFVAQYLQLVAQLSPLLAGLAMAPGMVAAIISFQISPLLARRIRPASLMSGGLLVAVIGLLMQTQVSATSGVVVLIVGFAVTSLGGGPLVTLGVNLVVGSVRPEKAGAAAAIAQTSNETGYALGVALLGSVGTAIYRSQIVHTLSAPIPSAVLVAARESLEGAVGAARSVPGQLAAELVNAARITFTDEYHAVAIISAILLVGVAALIVVMLRHVRPIGEKEVPAPESSTPVEVA
jgi:DHA2 family multidrug resistance protein-like MFS transporter